ATLSWCAASPCANVSSPRFASRGFFLIIPLSHTNTATGAHRLVDEQQRSRIADDLKGFFQGDLHFDALTRTLYSTDASIFQVQPLGVAVPRDEADVQALVRYAAEQRLPLIPRGAGTGLAGEALGTGLVVDL